MIRNIRKQYNNHISDVKLFISIFLYITFILFFISPDSYTHDLHNHCDSAWFFMAGKAWMNGMTPYVDFTDSKGPLLWLIYGIAYLLSPHTYLGVFWFSCINYAVTFFLCYKTAMLLSGNHKKSIAATLCMILPYFCFWFHYEIRAEDFCQPFVISGIYFLLENSLHPSPRKIKASGFITGCGFAACLLMKWSIAIMYLSFIFSLGYIAFKKELFKKYILYTLFGISVLLLPFLIYFYRTGNLTNLIHEYFITTSKTVQLSPLDFIKTYISEWAITLSSNKIIYIGYLAGIYYYYKRDTRMTYAPLICCFCFLAISIHHDLEYYTTILASFAIFGIVYLTTHLNAFGKILFVIIIITFQVRAAFLRPNLYFQKSIRKEHYAAAYLMSQVPHPTIVNEGPELGIGFPINVLPATKYWSRQTGETIEMKAERHNAIKSGKPDFITQYLDNETEDEQFQKLVTEAGYTLYCQVTAFTGRKVNLFGKPGLRLPGPDFTVSNWDILLKRKIFN